MDSTSAKEYDLTLSNGVAKMAKSSVAICGLVRDSGHTLRRQIPFIEELMSLFKESSCYIVENDSKDATKEILKEWSKNNQKLVIHSQDYGIQTISNQNASEHPKARFFAKHRIENMIKYRNIYLELLKENFKGDVVIMIDLDVEEIPLDGIKHSFGLENWDAITANGKKLSPRSLFKPIFYDTYAFREKDEQGPTTLKKIHHYQEKYKDLKMGDQPFLVDSGFNGLAIYRWDSIKGIKYKAIENDDEVVQCACEHVSFHQDMIKNGNDQIFVNPSLLVHYEKINVALYWNKLLSKLKLA